MDTGIENKTIKKIPIDFRRDRIIFSPRAEDRNMINITTIGQFAFLTMEAVNPSLSEQERKRASLLASANLTTAAIEQVYQGKFDYSQLKQVLKNPQVLLTEQAILDHFRQPQPGEENRFDNQLAEAINQLFPKT